MTQKEFIEVLKDKGYSYEMEGDKIIVTHKWYINLNSLTSLPSGVEFNNGDDVDLYSLTSLPPGVEFRNKERVYLISLIGGFIDEWEGNIDGIDSKRLLNLMIKQGMFI